jgi:TonB family protein
LRPPSSHASYGTLVPPPTLPVLLSLRRNLMHSIGVFPDLLSQRKQKMQEFIPTRSAGSPQGRMAATSQQSRKLMLALILLLIALVVILVNDRQFWFGTEQATIESDVPESPSPAASVGGAAAQAHPAAKRPFPAPKTASEIKPAEGAVVSDRIVLPPLEVEVIAGNTHRALHPKNNITRVETARSNEIAAPTNAAEREPVSSTAIQSETAASATYPALTQHMNVQGSVVLQAIISAAGAIEDLRVLSGPTILASAAQQAVREWRFKPVMLNGQAVETKARITVNFSIRVGDNTAGTTLAESRASDALIITR